MDYFQSQKANMLARFGPAALNHPHPGTIGRGLTPEQTLAAINPAFQNYQAYAHITRDYSAPITIQEEPLTQPMEIDN